MTIHDRLAPLCQHLYFQSPTHMDYPCIRYEITDMPADRANDTIYNLHHCYRLDVISKNPKDSLRDAVAKLPHCRFDRFYASDGMNHWVYTIYEN